MARQVQKGEVMNENMTNSEMVIFLKMILQIVKDSKDKEEIEKKIEELLKNNSSITNK